MSIVYPRYSGLLIQKAIHMDGFMKVHFGKYRFWRPIVRGIEYSDGTNCNRTRILPFRGALNYTLDAHYTSEQLTLADYSRNINRSSIFP